jgi:hypothetical protein
LHKHDLRLCGISLTFIAGQQAHRHSKITSLVSNPCGRGGRVYSRYHADVWRLGGCYTQAKRRCRERCIHSGGSDKTCRRIPHVVHAPTVFCPRHPRGRRQRQRQRSSTPIILSRRCTAEPYRQRGRDFGHEPLPA